MTESKYGAIGIIGCNKRTTLNAYIEETKELEQYRAIGTVEEIKSFKDDFWKLNEMCREYSTIGTIERFRELTEKAEPKKVAMKPLRDYDSERDANWCSCPNCFRGIGWEYERHFNFCNECGTEFDWE